MVKRHLGGSRFRHKVSDGNKSFNRKFAETQREQRISRKKSSQLFAVARQFIREADISFGKGVLLKSGGRAADTNLYKVTVAYYARLVALHDIIKIISEKEVLNPDRVKSYVAFLSHVPKEMSAPIYKAACDEIEKRLAQNGLIESKKK